MKKILKSKKIILCILFLLAFLIYAWTFDLPVVGDGLMHMNDNTDLSIKNMLKCFYTFDGLKKPINSYLLGFHRPVFDEIIIEILKKAFDYNVYWIRFVTILGYAFSAIISYMIGEEIFQDKVKSIVLSVFMIFSIVRFPGVYDVGLSFSVWLVLFLLLSLLYTVKYEKYGGAPTFVLSILFTGVTLYTKESAMTLGVALALWYDIKSYSKNKKISKTMIGYTLAQMVLLVTYMYTRMLKLGNIFEVTGGGINADHLSIIECIKKSIGYFLICFNIPNPICFEAYMCPQLNFISLGFALVILCAVLFSIYKLGVYVKEKNKKAVDLIVYIVCYLVLLLPVFKTTRNATYYGDILAIFAGLFLLTALGNGKKIYYWIIGITLCYVMVYAINIHDYVKPNSSYYLQCISNEAKTLRDELKIEKVDTKKILFTTDWEADINTHFKYNHMGDGSFYKFNIDVKKETGILTKENIKDIKESTLIDYFKSEDGTYKCFLYDCNNNRGNKVVQVQYDVDDNDSIMIGFYYENKAYYSTIQTEYKKTWNQDNCIYLVVPEEVQVNIIGNGVSQTIIGD